MQEHYPLAESNRPRAFQSCMPDTGAMQPYTIKAKASKRV